MKKLTIFFVFFFSFSLNVSAGVVDTTKTYTYEDTLSDIKELKAKYPSLVEYKTIGKTKFNRDLWAVKVGKGEPVLFINGSHHAREWMTTMLNMKFIERYLEAYTENELIKGYDVKKLLDEGAIWFVPMVNPDGVTLQQSGLSAFPVSYHDELIKMNDGSKDFKRWKANAEGIDLNRQYPANWNTYSGTGKPYWWNYNGEEPFQTNENKAIRDFTYEIMPTIAVAYHSSGRILYWNYKTKKENLDRDYKLAKEFSDMTNYRLVEPKKNQGGKGYTDWFIEEFGLPGFTPEISYYAGQTHVPLSVFPEVWKRNETIGIWLLEEAIKIKDKNVKPITFNEKIELHKQTNTYIKPRETALNSMTLEPQTVNAFEKYENWYHIETVEGNRWINVPHENKYFPERPFIDVKKDFWAKDGITFVKEKEWMVGVTSGAFKPNDFTTRAQVAVILARILNLPISPVEKNSFADIDETFWAYKEIEAVKANGIFGGYSNGKFGPNDNITREQLAVVLARISEGELMESEERPFTDVSQNHWAKKEIELMKNLGIFGGYSDGSFGVGDNATRAQMAVLMNRIALNLPEIFKN